MLNYVGNIKCVNNKMAIHIWNAKLLFAAIGINRECKAWIIKEIEGEHETATEKKNYYCGKIYKVCELCSNNGALPSFFFIYSMNMSASTFNGQKYVWSYTKSNTDSQKYRGVHTHSHKNLIKYEICLNIISTSKAKRSEDEKCTQNEWCKTQIFANLFTLLALKLVKC